MAPDTTKAFQLIDAAHSEDPNKITIASQELPYELHYAQLMTKYLLIHTPSPSPTVSTACRAQHFRRWETPRSSYPLGKAGYYSWRTYLKKLQAEQVKAVCLDCSYSEDEANAVARLIAKEDLKRGNDTGDAEAQIVEDVACLVFLDDQFDKFEEEHDEEKIVGILKKTWVKMGERGREVALGGEMRLSERAREMVAKALSS